MAEGKGYQKVEVTIKGEQNNGAAVRKTLNF